MEVRPGIGGKTTNGTASAGLCALSSLDLAIELRVFAADDRGVIEKHEVTWIQIGFELPDSLEQLAGCDQAQTWARACEILRANLVDDYRNADITFVKDDTWELELKAEERCFARTLAPADFLLDDAKATLLAHLDWIEGTRKLWNKAYVSRRLVPEVGPIGPRKRPSALAERLAA